MGYFSFGTGGGDPLGQYSPEITRTVRCEKQEEAMTDMGYTFFGCLWQPHEAPQWKYFRQRVCPTGRTLETCWMDGLHVPAWGNTESPWSSQEEFKPVAWELEVLAALPCLLEQDERKTETSVARTADSEPPQASSNINCNCPGINDSPDRKSPAAPKWAKVCSSSRRRS